MDLPRPSEKQKLFLRDRHKYVGYGGARGGGKSWAVRVKAVLLCLRYAGIKVMIVRKTYPELQENHIVPLCEMLGCYLEGDERLAVYNDSKKQIAFPNGSRILFRYLENERDALRFQGTEVDVLFVDEATASLDAETSFEVLDAILKLDGYTRVIVTHDLDENILRRCTGLFTLKNGAVAEKGTFDNLMEKKGYFYSLFTVSQR